MKKVDYNRVVSLRTRSGVTLEVCIQLIIQLSDDHCSAAYNIVRLLNDTKELEEPFVGTAGKVFKKISKSSKLSRGATLLVNEISLDK